MHNEQLTDPPAVIRVPSDLLAVDGGGWIVYGDAGLIWGIGATESEARDDAERSAAVAGCSLAWDALCTYRATARLLDAVRVGGGDVRWHSVTIDGRWHADVRT